MNGKSESMYRLVSFRFTFGFFLLLTCFACGGGGASTVQPAPTPTPTPTPTPKPEPLLEVVVSPFGSQGNPGTAAAPTTLENARAILRATSRTRPGALRVLLRGGIYARTSAFQLDSSDAGTTDNPIEYTAYPGETPRLVGGASLDPSTFHLANSSDPNWDRLDPIARAKIYVADITAYKSSLGSLASRVDSATATGINRSMEVFVDGEALTLARYPKAVDPETVNLAPISTLHVAGSPVPDVTGDYNYKGLSSGQPSYQLDKGAEHWSIAFDPDSGDWSLSNDKALRGTGSFASWGTYENFAGPAGSFEADPNSGRAKGYVFISPSDGSRAMSGFMLVQGTPGSAQILAPDAHMARWKPGEAMYYGFFNNGYIAGHIPITALDAGRGTIQLANEPSGGLRVGRPFFIYNLLEELTAPGDFFVDTVHARLYMRPNGDVAPKEILVSLLSGSLLYMEGAEHTTWQGVVFESSLNKLVEVIGCNNVTFKDCLFRNCGGWGLLLDGSHNLVDACEFKQLGAGGIWVCGGDRATLTSSETVIQNCNIHHFGRLFWTYQPAIEIASLSNYTYNDDCAGITVQNNEIHHSPHTAILFKGNNHHIRYNHIHQVCQWSNDVGAIYTARDWGCQGNSIQFNLIRACGSPFGTWASGIYLDACSSGITAEGNILYKATLKFAIQHNGGRDITLRYNIMVGHIYGVDTSNVGFTTINNTSGDGWNLLGKIQHFKYQSAPWSTSYPALAAMPNDWSQIHGTHWIEPENSILYGNLHQGISGDVVRETNYAPSGLASPLGSFAQNESNLSQKDPQFVDPTHLDFRLQSTSPMFAIPGFPGIDASKIGIQH